MQDFEQLGAFYLGRRFDPQAGVTQEPLLYDARDLTTHAVCVGMTGSGKSGLGISLIEEAAIDGIPVIVIDPKGDMGNLLLSFPDLEADDFLPWMDEADAARAGRSVSEQAAKTAALWRSGLAEWGQDSDRVRRYGEAAERVIYTPGSSAGRPLSILRSFNVPPAKVMEDPEALREHITSCVSGLFALLGIDADPMLSREHTLLANILETSWLAGVNVDLPGLIQRIQKPPFERIGVFDLETFFPASDRLALAMRINNLLASPGFAAWAEGDALDINRLLYADDGRPRISILSIAHLSDRERMSFVTLLLGELIIWMRSQPGSRSLRAMLYMDEIFGYFPPVANPPSKQPMLTLLKQARAFGIGAVLATQNPVDLDYKGLSNCGTWFIGRLQTERDKQRVLEGLEGAAASAGGSFDRSAMEQTLAGLGSRVFLMNNVHEDAPVLFHTRWVLSYLAGPMTREQIRRLQPVEEAGETKAVSVTGRPTPTVSKQVKEAMPEPAQTPQLPQLPVEIEQAFLPLPPNSRVKEYQPALLAECVLHFSNRSAKVDEWKTIAALAYLDDSSASRPWESAEFLSDGMPDLEQEAQVNLAFASVPAACQRVASYGRWKKMLLSDLYRSQVMTLYKCRELKLVSQPGEPESAFRGRLREALRDQRDLQVAKLRKRYTPKLARLEERIRVATQRVEQEHDQYQDAQTQAAVSVGTTVLGALFGRKLGSRSNVGKAASTLRRATKISKEKEDIGRAQETLAARQADLADLEQEFSEALEDIRSGQSVDDLEINEVSIRPRKSDLSVDRLILVWTA